MKNSEIKVLAAADDNDAYGLECLKNLSQSQGSYFCIEKNFLKCIDLLRDSSFDILIADPFTVSENPISILKELNESAPNLQIIIFSA
ncbi:MAG TPA: hypothetical protein PKK94_22790, partial [Leptospiraceae bacterium]|nr:hypothetical protein [Leptospiraceae bacterium]